MCPRVLQPKGMDKEDWRRILYFSIMSSCHTCAAACQENPRRPSQVRASCPRRRRPSRAVAWWWQALCQCAGREGWTGNMVVVMRPSSSPSRRADVSRDERGLLPKHLAPGVVVTRLTAHPHTHPHGHYNPTHRFSWSRLASAPPTPRPPFLLLLLAFDNRRRWRASPAL